MGSDTDRYGNLSDLERESRHQKYAALLRSAEMLDAAGLPDTGSQLRTMAAAWEAYATVYHEGRAFRIGRFSKCFERQAPDGSWSVDVDYPTALIRKMAAVLR